MSGSHGTFHRTLRAFLVGGLLTAATTALSPLSAQAITGGNAVTDDSFDFVAHVIHTPSGNSCTGTLITASRVLTAAHCVGGVSNAQASDMAVRVGINVRGTGGQYRRASWIWSYPTYKGAHNDVAVLRLEAPVTGVKTVPLAHGSMRTRWDGQSGGPFTRYDDGIAVGWGVNGAGALPNRLQFRGVYIKPAQKDRDGLKMIPTDGGPCRGDSGGPLLISFKGQLFQVGVMKGQNCSTTASYSEVGTGYLRSWVLSKL
ncbi:S1 family peptidase [Streptomyces sp. CB03234]|uniref:S1 family peptidase n=1 Tax=Streptomyces sp. (strain CB03234) TaxID=1703937 RepID=UPI00093B4568|nr:trypsin-like serine protease [Streptomyces sp. CB03234]